MVVYSLRTKTREERNRACNDNENDQGIFVSWRPKRRHGAIREKRPIVLGLLEEDEPRWLGGDAEWVRQAW